jgi:hypothetical protein
MEADKAALLNMKDNGKWLPFMFDMDIVVAIKLSSDEEEDFTYNCTTIYTMDNDNYVIDTPFSIFARMFKEYRDLFDFRDDEIRNRRGYNNNTNSDGDLEL